MTKRPPGILGESDEHSGSRKKGGWLAVVFKAARGWGLAPQGGRMRAAGGMG